MFMDNSDKDMNIIKASLQTGFKLTVSTSHVNVPVLAMLNVLYLLGVPLCKVSFLMIKWSNPNVELVIDLLSNDIASR